MPESEDTVLRIVASEAESRELPAPDTGKVCWATFGKLADDMHDSLEVPAGLREGDKHELSNQSRTKVATAIGFVDDAIAARRREVELGRAKSVIGDSSTKQLLPDSLLVQLTGLRQLCDEIHESGKITKTQTDRLAVAIFAVSDIAEKNELLAQWLSQDGLKGWKTEDGETVDQATMLAKLSDAGQSGLARSVSRLGKPIDWTGIADLATKLANSLDVLGVTPSTVATANELREIANDAVANRRKQLLRRDEWTDGNRAYPPKDTVLEHTIGLMKLAVHVLMVESGRGELHDKASGRLRAHADFVRTESVDGNKPQNEALIANDDKSQSAAATTQRERGQPYEQALLEIKRSGKPSEGENTPEPANDERKGGEAEQQEADDGVLEPLAMAKTWLDLPRRNNGPTKDQQDLVRVLIESGGRMSPADISTTLGSHYEDPRDGVRQMVKRINDRLSKSDQQWEIAAQDRGEVAIVIRSHEKPRTGRGQKHGKNTTRPKLVPNSSQTRP